MLQESEHNLADSDLKCRFITTRHGALLRISTRVSTESLKSTQVSTIEFSFYECTRVSPEYFTKVLMSTLALILTIYMSNSINFITSMYYKYIPFSMAIQGTLEHSENTRFE